MVMSMLDNVELDQSVAKASAVLGVDAMASASEVKSAWKRRAFEMHPDRGTGSHEDLIRINLAYDVLKKRRPDQMRADAPKPRAPGSRPTSQPVRPDIRSRTHLVTAAEHTACTAALARHPDAAATDHTARAIDRKGRRITYTVSTGLAAGLNRIAVPTGFLVDNKSVAPVIVQLETQTMGAATYHVPEATRKALFKGAAEVVIRFAALV